MSCHFCLFDDDNQPFLLAKEIVEMSVDFPSTDVGSPMTVSWKALECCMKDDWILCDRCHRKPSDGGRLYQPYLAYEEKFPWAVFMKCPYCFSSPAWFLCLACAKTFKPPAGGRITTATHRGNHAVGHKSKDRPERYRRYMDMLRQLKESGVRHVEIGHMVQAGLCTSPIVEGSPPGLSAPAATMRDHTRDEELEQIEGGISTADDDSGIIFAALDSPPSSQDQQEGGLQESESQVASLVRANRRGWMCPANHLETVYAHLATLQQAGKTPVNFLDVITVMSTFPLDVDNSRDECMGKIHDARNFFEPYLAGGSGMREVVAQAVAGNPLAPMPTDRAKFHLLLACFILELSVSQREVLFSLLSFASAARCKPCSNAGCNPCSNAFCYKSASEMSGKLVDRKSSLCNSLPNPVIHNLNDDMAYVSLLDTVCHHLRFGENAEPLFSGSKSPLANAPRAKAILEYARNKLGNLDGVLLVCAHFWSDAFDPNNIKGNRHNVWCIQVSIGTPSDKFHSGCSTYVIALGRSSEDKSKVLEYLKNDIEALASGTLETFHGKLRKVVKVMVVPYTKVMDRPEKASETQTTGGNGTFHACFGVAGDFLSVEKKIPSCSECMKARLENVLPERPCRNGCFDWELQQVSYPAPKGYPTGGECTVLDGRSMLQGRKVTFGSIQEAINLCHEKMFRGDWSAPEGRTFLRTHALSPVLIESVVDHTKKQRKELKDSYQGRRMSLDWATAAVPPPLESPPSHLIGLMDLDDYVAAPMHHLFLGVSQTIHREIVLPWMKSRRRRAQVVKKINHQLKRIHDLGLGWCKIQMLNDKGTFGSFVSEDHMGYARMTRYLQTAYLSYESQSDNRSEAEEDEVYEDPPGVLIADYTRPQLRAWMDARHLTYHQDDTDDELRTRIFEVVELCGGIPEIIDDVQGSKDVSINDLEKLLSSMVAMIGRIMGAKEDISDKVIADMDRHIRLFLSYLDKVDAIRRQGKSRRRDPPSTARQASARKRHRCQDSSPAQQASPEVATTSATSTPAEETDATASKKSSVPIWISSYNLITLLQQPNSIRNLGSCRLFWEGDKKGEGGLPLLKSCILSLRGKWAAAALGRYYRLKSLKQCTQFDKLMGAHSTSSLSPTMDAAKLIEANLDSKGTIDARVTSIDDELFLQDRFDSTKETKLNNIRRSRGCYLYKSSAEFEVAMATGSCPLSIVGLEIEGSHTTVFGYLVGDPKSQQGGLKFYQVERASLLHARFSATFFVWQPSFDAAGGRACIDLVQQSSWAIIHYCMLLPYLGAKGVGGFQLVTSEWKELHADGQLDLPRLFGAHYDATLYNPTANRN